MVTRDKEVGFKSQLLRAHHYRKEEGKKGKLYAQELCEQFDGNEVCRSREKAEPRAAWKLLARNYWVSRVSCTLHAVLCTPAHAQLVRAVGQWDTA
jgi:hypothetical protein